MTVRYEWHSAEHTRVGYVPPMHFPDGEEATEEDRAAAAEGYEVEGMTQTGALVLSSDEAAVIEGTPDELRALLLRALAALPAGSADSDPAVVTIESDDDGAEAIQVRRVDATHTHVIVLDRLHLDPAGTVVETTPHFLMLDPDPAAAIATAVLAANNR